MRCGQCGRKLTEAALAMGYCPSCGNLLSAGEPLPLTPTDHMLAQAAEQQSAAGFAPPAVATTRLPPPIALPPVANVPVAPRYSHPIDLPSGRPAAGPSRPLPQPPVMPAPTPDAVVTQVRPQSTNALLIALIVVVVLVVVAGGGLFVAGKQGAGPFAFLGTTTNRGTPVAATATALPTNTPMPTATPMPTVPSPPPGFVTFYSQDRSFGLNYDQSWTHAGPTPDSGERGNSYNFTSPQQQFFQVTEATTTIVPADITQFIQTFITNSNGTGFQMTGSLTKTTNGANTWTTAQGTYMDGTGQTWNIIGLANNHKQHGYIVIYTAPTAVYTTLPDSQFAEMVNSFTFL